jgi:enoyl-CoA hydratase
MTEESGRPRVRVEFPAMTAGGKAAAATGKAAALGGEATLGGIVARGREAAALRPVDGVALVTIDRREALNAIDRATMEQLLEALERLDDDPTCRCMVITGVGDRAFAAGADIREMSEQTAASIAASGGFERWDRIARIATPLIAAVKGYALGGGCELAMTCDMIVAAADAVFGLPEVRLGVMPGAGGTQRLLRAMGKAKAMELILTGRNLPAVEAEAHGLVSLLVPRAEVVACALALAETIAAMPPLAVRAAVQAIDQAAELPLGEGLAAERKAFYALFETEDQKEGMRAFLEKRPADWKGR